MKDWTQETAEYEKKIAGMDYTEAANFLWREYYFEHRLSRRAFNWMDMFLEEYLSED